MNANTKTVVELYPDTQHKVKKTAKKSGQSVKRFASLLMDFALRKFDSGEIAITDPEIKETSAASASRRKPPTK